MPVEGRFERDLARAPCGLLTASMVSSLAAVDASALQRYELGDMCTYVWAEGRQASIRRLVVADTVDEAEQRHRGVLALDGCDPIGDVGDEACVHDGHAPYGDPDADPLIRIAVRVSNARFSVVWDDPQPELLVGRLRAVALARKVVAALPDDVDAADVAPPIETGAPDSDDAEAVHASTHQHDDVAGALGLPQG